MHPVEDVSTYPRPPRVELVQQRATIHLDGVVVCSSDTVVRVLETWHPPTIYVPREAFTADVLHAARKPLSTTCEWKGSATYLDLVTPGGDRIERGAWTYERPRPGFELLSDHVAVYAGRMERCELDEELVTAQSGSFYGGWITSWITGPIKGAAGSNHW